MKNILLKQKGFTLIEIVTVVVVLAILGLFTFSFIDNAVKTYAIGSKQRMIYQEASNIMERITRELRDADTIYISYNGDDSIYFRKVNTSGQIDTREYIRYYKSGTNLYRSSNNFWGFGWIPRLITEKASQFSVSKSVSNNPCDDSTPSCMVTIDLRLTDASIPVNDVSGQLVSISTTVTPKNYGTSTSNYINRCFNGGYYDVVQ